MVFIAFPLLLGGHNKCTRAKPGLAGNGWHQYDCNVISWCIPVVTGPAKSGPRLAVMTGMSGKQMLLRSSIKYSCYFCDRSGRREPSADFLICFFQSDGSSPLAACLQPRTNISLMQRNGSFSLDLIGAGLSRSSAVTKKRSRMWFLFIDFSLCFRIVRHANALTEKDGVVMSRSWGGSASLLEATAGDEVGITGVCSQ